MSSNTGSRIFGRIAKNRGYKDNTKLRKVGKEMSNG
jgi:hypothetical protein